MSATGGIRAAWERCAARVYGGERALICVVLGLAALCVRLAYLIAYHSSPFYHVPVIDAEFHHQWALDILSGDWLSLKQGDVLYKAPLYPYLLAAIYRVFGVNFTAVRLIQAALGSASAAMLYLLGERFFSRRAGCIAALLYSLYFVAIFFDLELEIVVVAIFLTLLSMLLISGDARNSRLIGAGAALGLSALALPTNLLLLPLWAGAAWRRSSWKGALYVVLAAVIVIAPCTARNLLVGRSLVLVSANAGMNFFIGNNPDYDKTVATPPGMAWTRFNAEAYPHGSQSHANADRYWTRRSLQTIKNAPGAWLALLAKKTVLYFQSHEITRNRDIYYAWGESPLSRLPFVTLALILPAGLLGLAVATLRRPLRALVPASLLALAAPCILFFVVSRYRLPSVTLWSLYAAAGLSWLYDTWRRRRYRAAVAATLAVAAMALLFTRGWFIPAQPAWRPQMSLGVIHRSRNRPRQAIEHFRRAFDLLTGSDDWTVYTRADIANKVGMLYGQLAQHDSSLWYLDSAITLVDDFDNAWFNRAISCLHADDNACALQSALHAQRLGNRHPDIDKLLLIALHRARPGDSVALATLPVSATAASRSAIRNYIAMRRAFKGDSSGALTLLVQAREESPRDPVTRVNLAALGHGVVDSLPPSLRAQAQGHWIALALQEVQAGHLHSAIILLQQAHRFGDNPVVLTHLGAAWLRLRNAAQSRSYLQRALQLQPDFEPALQMLAAADSLAYN